MIKVCWNNKNFVFGENWSSSSAFFFLFMITGSSSEKTSCLVEQNPVKDKFPLKANQRKPTPTVQDSTSVTQIHILVKNVINVFCHQMLLLKLKARFPEYNINIFFSIFIHFCNWAKPLRTLFSPTIQSNIQFPIDNWKWKSGLQLENSFLSLELHMKNYTSIWSF